MYEKDELYSSGGYWSPSLPLEQKSDAKILLLRRLFMCLNFKRLRRLVMTNQVEWLRCDRYFRDWDNRYRRHLQHLRAVQPRLNIVPPIEPSHLRNRSQQTQQTKGKAIPSYLDPDENLIERAMLPT